MDREPYIAEVLSIQGFHVTVKLTDGSTRELDLEPYLWGEAAKELKDDPKKFNAVYVEDGTLVWPNGQDICPDELLETETYHKMCKMAQKVKERWVKEGMPTISEFAGIKIRVDGGG